MLRLTIEPNLTTEFGIPSKRAFHPPSAQEVARSLTSAVGTDEAQFLLNLCLDRASIIRVCKAVGISQTRQGFIRQIRSPEVRSHMWVPASVYHMKLSSLIVKS
ncbi:hypothetical protein HO173_012863 [Letharia columbiana]|uniref:Uncharacterized protein n=1 Tax=Letharia columbiana TaxID=112416 RepID=A0A8H6FE36_9LECA|nr:uncharacterized protein HO173_012863 [Letharia columbiana]KAF6224706.1 hypothetical protein HO173_012863 [Letharia columbiana]